jgi:hypothetical protein
MLKFNFLLILYLFHLIFNQYSNDIFDYNKNIRFCGADLQHYTIKISSKISEEHNPSRKLSSVFSPIRIILETTYFEQQGYKIPSLRDRVPMLLEAMNKAIKALTDILEVENYGNDIFIDLNETLFRQYKIYSWSPIFDNIGEDIPADLIILTKFEEEGEFPQGVLASAMPIVLYKSTNRPIVGLLTVSRSENFYSYNNIKEYFSFVFLHELTHVLGFLESMFHYFPQGIDNILTYKMIRGANRALIKTPKVVERAKKYFNCESLEGLELEDQGGGGSALSHWEQRILLGEYMGAVIYQEEMAISEFTLAFLEDSGWYKAKYYTGGLFRFGKHKGCKFIENSCIYNDNGKYKTDFKNEFFDEDNSWYGSCSTGRQSRTYAITFNYNGFSAGAIYTADYCPTNGQRYDEIGNNYFFGSCKYGSYNYGSYIYYINNDNQAENGHPNSVLPKEISESISDNSFCIMTNLVPKGKEKLYKSVFHPMCYETYCSSKSLTIKIKNNYIVCPREGGNVEVEGFDGFLNCPDYNLICTGTVLCNDIFDCIDKKSLVKNNTYEYDYDPISSIENNDLEAISPSTAFELSNDGKCPINLSICKDNQHFINNKLIILPLIIKLFLLLL